jgi:hypothetical protein
MQRQLQPRSGWLSRSLLTLLAGVVLAGGGLAARGPLQQWTRGRLHQQHVQRIRSLSEEQAAAATVRLVVLDSDAPSVLAPLLVEKRQGVATAAASAIDRLIADWSRLPREASSPRVAALARDIASVAPQLAPEQRRWSHALATRLVVWPLTDELAASGQVVADCETVLRFPVPDEPDVRVAAASRGIKRHEAEFTESVPLPIDLPGAVPYAPEPVENPDWPRVYGPVEPGRLIDASKERPSEPKQFLPPRAMKIEG